ncbi:hypothetical protein M9R32_09900 [Paenisporosarcina quisquiliarum]|uniref:Uncharacterized protein n=1 Tax=Paenisporosarcina quisquiliarum TaxID=365346 RepID=A0A9X3LGG3_9BACL|nr:hypothetical protein [Paenisporosarcina quisquiliarum]MCZ8537493.1 hypothetical protein [Paenisporosarcina quisquiliarum]
MQIEEAASFFSFGIEWHSEVDVVGTESSYYLTVINPYLIKTQFNLMEIIRGSS